jgi:hypothetical protein
MIVSSLSTVLDNSGNFILSVLVTIFLVVYSIFDIVDTVGDEFFSSAIGDDVAGVD